MLSTDGKGLCIVDYFKIKNNNEVMMVLKETIETKSKHSLHDGH